MQRYFIDTADFSRGTVPLPEDVQHHVNRVMRMEEGDSFILCSGGTCVEAELLSENEAQVKGLLENDPELPVSVTIAHGLPKADKLELVIQKGTELGADAFFPFEASRSVVRLDEKKAVKKQERWQKIAREAAEQSHRSRVPYVFQLQSKNALIQRLQEADYGIIAYEENAKSGDHEGLHRFLETVEPGADVVIVLGPEGGLTPEEAEAFSPYAAPVSLGPRILRTETAPLYLLSVFSYYFELMR
ncbi:16S rRNA (uracil(1498)-N(3))-methyltransferase [Alkalicoccus urumqiensis]|uniref:Ribosomal RNA small subunit methyltransferase E n=1 Tax=Alkalicoccus urumqiensis TaxID=1548213 RepID=A0A2P6MFN0_ALKUR|nr:16S rRNA (uracil(1498)-N(3))-methyltransferase [Alkalicoccus urumqiensis]PRO65096.1 16S rRNA (uracil(1498)-N(3))-methyltransferase [Alkalicoccus urumqiensis]